MFLIVCGVFTLSSCSDDDEDNAKCPVSVSEMSKSATIGAEYRIKGSGFASIAKFSFQNETVTSYLEDVQITPTEVIFTIPNTLIAGKYDLMLEQEGSWKLGEVTLVVKDLPVTDLKLPDSMEIGNEVLIEGNGFTEDMKLFLVPAEGDKVEMDIKLAENGIKAVVPDNAIAGDYSLFLIQGNFEWNLGTVNVTKPVVKRIKSFIFDMGMGTEMVQTWKLGYNDDNRLTSIDVTWMENPYAAYQFVHSENKIEVVSDGYYFDLKDGKIVYNSFSKQNWEYDDNNYLNFDGEHEIKYENGNWISCDYNQLVYNDPTLKSKSTAVDMSAYIFKFLLVALGDDDYMDIFLPHILNICGTTSVNLPSGFMNLETGEEVKFEYVFDDHGYVEEVKTFSAMMEATLSLQFEYEVVE